jgi:hypothetical protein
MGEKQCQRIRKGKVVGLSFGRWVCEVKKKKRSGTEPSRCIDPEARSHAASDGNRAFSLTEPV